MNRFGEPNELLGSVFWLASDASSFVTGSEITIDGGFSCMDCTSKKDEFLSENKDLLNEYQSSKALRMKLSDCLQMAYKDISHLNDIERGMVQALFNYINFQFGFTKDQFKTWKMVGEN